MYKIMYDIVVIIILWKLSFSMHMKMKALRTTCICMLLYTVEAIFFNAHHITFDISFPSKSVLVLGLEGTFA